MRPGEPEFDNLPLKGNHDNDERGVRMMRAWWPEFRWKEFPNDPFNDDMVYERIIQDISRLLYTNDGEIYVINNVLKGVNVLNLLGA